MKTKIITEIKDFIEMESGWNELIHDSEFNVPFNSWYWYKKWWEYFGDNQGLFIVVSFDNYGQLMAVAPLCRKRKKIKGINVKELLFMSNFISPYNTIIYRKSENSIKYIVNIFNHLEKCKKQWDVISLVNMDSRLRYVKELERHKKEFKLNLIINTELCSPYIEIDKDFNKYLKENFKSKARYNIKRAVKIINKERKCEVVKFMDGNELQNVLEQAFDVSMRSWKGIIGQDFGANEAKRDFYRDITKYFGEKGQIAIWTLNINEQIVAFEFQIVNNGKIYLLINDFDKKYSKLSPGIALLYYVIEDCFEQKIKKFDFCGDSYNYKIKWSHGVKKTVTVQVFNNRKHSFFIYLCKKKLLPLLRTVKVYCEIFSKKILVLTHCQKMPD